MIVYWIYRTPVAWRKLRIAKGTTILKAFFTLDGKKGYDELVEWGGKVGLVEEDLHAGRSGQIHFDLWGNKLVEGIKELLKEIHRSYSWQAKKRERESRELRVESGE